MSAHSTENSDPIAILAEWAGLLIHRESSARNLPKREAAKIAARKYKTTANRLTDLADSKTDDFGLRGALAINATMRRELTNEIRKLEAQLNQVSRLERELNPRAMAKAYAAVEAAKAAMNGDDQ